MALRQEMCLPDFVFGPVERFAFSRFAAALPLLVCWIVTGSVVLIWNVVLACKLERSVSDRWAKGPVR